MATGTGLGVDLGTHVPVAYLPNHLETARVFTRRHFRPMYISMLAGSGIFLGVAVWIVLKS